MSFVTRILPESFVHLGTLHLIDAGVNVSVGHVEQNGVLHENKAIKVNVFFKDADHEYNCVFKGEDMVQKASEWLFLKTEGEFTMNDVGPKWMTKLLENPPEWRRDSGIEDPF